MATSRHGSEYLRGECELGYPIPRGGLGDETAVPFASECQARLGSQFFEEAILFISITNDSLAMNTQVPTKYYLYIRKSTDEEDRQVLSLEAQLHELKEFAEREHIEIVETFIEKKTAKAPGRMVFNEMLDKLESGLPHQYGIASWHPLC